MGSDEPDIRVGATADGLGLLLEVANLGQLPVTVGEPHPHTSVELYDEAGERVQDHHGVFAATPRWWVTLPAGGAARRAVILPRFFLGVRGLFEAVCRVPYRVGDREGRLTTRGRVRLALPVPDEYYADAEARAGVWGRVERYQRAGFVYPLPDEAEPGAAADPRRPSGSGRV